MHAWRCPRCRSALAVTPDERLCGTCGRLWHREGRRWLAYHDVSPERFDRAAVDRIRALDEHFWMRERRHLIASRLRRLGVGGRTAVELGCGTGGFLPILESRFAHVTAVDAHAPLLEHAERNSSKTELLQADVCRLPLAEEGFDLVMALDVIEHVDPDAFLREARRIAAPAGTLLLSAPASSRLWSALDERAAHRCRYERRQMEEELRRNDWTPMGGTYYQCLLFPLVLLSSKVGTRARDRVERRPPAWLDSLLGVINHLETTLLGRYSLPFGSSLLMWARAD